MIHTANAPPAAVWIVAALVITLTVQSPPLVVGQAAAFIPSACADFPPGSNATIDFGAAAVDCWSRGGTVDDLERLAHTDAGDVVRTLRMAIQMMRQVRMTVGKGEALGARLEEASVAINRDVVDAKRQFELG